MPSLFPTTRWSLVLRAADPASNEGRAALGELFQLSWYPLYAFLRQGGLAAQDAEDLLQGFFSRIVEKKSLAGLAEGRGRFRNFLLVCLKRFVAQQREAATAQKRGGGRTAIPLALTAGDLADADTRFQAEATTNLTPERIYQRRWALATLELAITRLADTWRRAGKAEQFELLKVYLTGEQGAPSHAETAQALGSTPAAVRTTVYRLKAQFRETLCGLVAKTLDRDELLEDELSQLFSALRR